MSEAMPNLPKDAELQVIAALFRATLPIRGKNRSEMLALRAQYRKDLGLMAELKKRRLLCER